MASIPVFFSLDALADGFSEIERNLLCVDKVFIHPEDASDFVHTMSSYTQEYDTECACERVKSGPICRIWGAEVHTDATVPRTRIRLVSDQSSGCGGEQVRGPMEHWI